MFCRLLDRGAGGYFTLGLKGESSTSRRYLPGTNILATSLEGKEGTAVLLDFMPVPMAGGPSAADSKRIVRILKCTEGSVEFELDCEPTFDYGSIVRHLTLVGQKYGLAHGGADALAIFSSAPLAKTDDRFEATGRLAEGEIVCFAVTYQSILGHEIEVLSVEDLEKKLDDTREFWENWSARCRSRSAHHSAAHGGRQRPRVAG